MVKFNEEITLKANGENITTETGLIEDFPNIEVLTVGGNEDFKVTFVDPLNSESTEEIADGNTVVVLTGNSFLYPVNRDNGSYLTIYSGSDNYSDLGTQDRNFIFNTIDGGFNLSTENNEEIGIDENNHLGYINSNSDFSDPVTFSTGGINRMWLIIGIAGGVLLLIIIIALIVFFVIRSKKKNKVDNDTNIDTETTPTTTTPTTTAPTTTPTTTPTTSTV